MIRLNSRKIDELGQVIISDKGIFELLYQGEFDPQDLQVEDSEEIRLYNKWVKLFDLKEDSLPIYSPLNITKEKFDKNLQDSWLIPEKYQQLNVEEFLLKKCKTKIEQNRVKEEIKLFQERDMEKVLQCLIYLVDHMRENKIVWGVGRGSACSSYALFLIGIHRIDSIKYDLDIKEFLK